MKVVACALAIASCSREPAVIATAPAGSGSGSAIAIAPAPELTRLVAVLGTTARLIEIAGAKVTTTARIELPSPAEAIVWAGKDPVALVDGAVGAITARGFVAIPSPPEATWPQRKPGDETPDMRELRATDGAPWLGRCTRGGIADGGYCEEWLWARLGNGPAFTSRVAPPDDDDDATGPQVAAAPGIAITFAKKSADAYEATMTCRRDGKTTIFPAEDNAWVDPRSLAWISTDPPIFAIHRQEPGYNVIDQLVVFEGCAISTTFEHPIVRAGPDELLVLASADATSIRRHGNELARLPGAEQVVFAPDGAETSELEILVRQLEGDTSMFAPDAIVLAPAPVRAAGVALVPPGIASARITSLVTGAGGPVRWFAAEVQLDGHGIARTYRAVELVDPATGMIAVASFAPVVPLGPLASAPEIPSPTAAGPLAALIASPATATLSTKYAIFGSDPDEHATDSVAAKALLHRWPKLALATQQVHEVRNATWGYAIATVTLAKQRMTALVIGAPDKAGTWQVVALHYLAL